MKVILIELAPLTPRRRIVLDSLPAVVGRSPDADICLDDHWVSRIHCEIDHINGPLLVRDLDSRNGTIVNGEYVREACILPGDRMRIGSASFEVRYKCSETSELEGIEEGLRAGADDSHAVRWRSEKPNDNGLQKTRAFA